MTGKKVVKKSSPPKKKGSGQEGWREAEKNYQAVFDYAPVVTAIIDEDATILFVNRKFEELSGYTQKRG